MRGHELADIAVYSPDGRLLALVEAKATHGTTVEWAESYRERVWAAAAHAELLVLATPDRIYLWPPERGRPIEVSGEEVFRPYFEQAHISAENVLGSAFELIVGSWIFDVTVGLAVPANASDILRRMSSGRVVFQDAA